MEQLTEFFHALVVHFGYGGLFLVMFFGNMGIPAGTEVVMPTAGALAGSHHLPDLGPIPAWLIVGLVGTLAETLGGLALYAVGWFGGVPFVQRYGKYVHFREHELERVHGFYAKYGKATVFWCRFIPFVRGVAALPPGISRMQKRYFLTYTALGSAIFCFSLSYLGDVAGKNVDAIVGYVHDFGMAFVGLAVLLAIAGGLMWRTRRRRVAVRGRAIKQK